MWIYGGSSFAFVDVVDSMGGLIIHSNRNNYSRPSLDNFQSLDEDGKSIKISKIHKKSRVYTSAQHMIAYRFCTSTESQTTQILNRNLTSNPFAYLN